MSFYVKFLDNSEILCYNKQKLLKGLCVFMERISDYNIYTEGMRKSMADKTWFLDKINGITNIIDYGCADGALLQYINEAYPNIFNLTGVDIDTDMLNLARDRIPSCALYTPQEFCVSSTNNSDSCLNIGSVIHEVYSYGNLSSIQSFWNFVFDSGFKYISIRDMAISKVDAVKKIQTVDNAVERIHKYNEVNRTREDRWEDFLGENNLMSNDDIQWKSIIHFLLKYRYIANWNREVRENYLPLYMEEILLKIPEGYRVKYFDHYTLPYLKDKIMEDFDIELQTKTHYKLLLEKV